MTFVQGLLEVKLHIDDPAVCIPVHAACGVWGIMATALFGATFLGGHPLFAASTLNAYLSQIGIQAIGALTIIAWAGGTGLALFWAINKAGLLRARKDAELFGLDIADHKTYAYPEEMMDQDFP
jgi:Amt family ammonium transporter